MPKLAATPIDAEGLKDYLLTQDDFALELRTLRAAARLGFRTEHGGTYDDPVTGKPRQFDLRAMTDPNIGRCLRLAIECKSLKASYPLLISRVPRTTAEGCHELIAGLNLPPSKFTINSVGNSHLYLRGAMVGKSITQVGRSVTGEWASGDDTYDKWSQALASARSPMMDAVSSLERANSNFVTAVLPILVVSNDALWVVDYEDDGTMRGEPKPADETTLYVDRRYDVHDREMRLTHLHVFTESGLETFLTRIQARDHLWDVIFGD